MKRIYFSKLLILTVLALGWGLGALAQTTTFTYTGSMQSYLVTGTGTSSLLQITCQGGAGANTLDQSQSCHAGGKGSQTVVTYTVTPGTTLWVGAGALGTTAGAVVFGGGGPGGLGNASCGPASYYAGSGGGASFVQLSSSPTVYTDRIVVAGGGGGSGGTYENCGSLGSGGYGGDGDKDGLPSNGCANSSFAGGGINFGKKGTLTSTANGGPCDASGPNNGTAGTLGVGGTGALGFEYVCGGGGGGGYYGGGGGGGANNGNGIGAGGGGGGSSFIGGTGVQTGSITTSVNTGAGSVVIQVLCTPPVPGPISGLSVVCAGSSIPLTTTTTAGGSWSSSNSAIATVNPSTGVVTGVAAGTASINYTVVFSCGTASATSPKIVTVNPVPTAIIGYPYACFGITSKLSDATASGTWSSSNTTIATINSGTGVVTGIALGNTTISYKLTTTGCYTLLPITTTVLPTLYPVTGGGSFCTGSTGPHINMVTTDPTVTYQLFNGTPVGAGVVGGAPIDFGAQSTGGTYSVIGTSNVTGCPVGMSGNPVVTPIALPTPLPLLVAGTGGYCATRGGLDVQLATSNAGVNYSLYQGGSALVSTLPGNGLPLDFGNQITGAVYTVLATDTTSKCSGPMLNPITITVNPLPTLHTATGGGAFCLGTTPVNDSLNGSDVGINYVLANGGIQIPSTLTSGTGSALNFGPQPAAGIYTVVANNPLTNCTDTMAGFVTVSINSLPTIDSMSPSGAYCPGGAGKDVSLNNSDLGVSYQLYNNVPVLATVGLPHSGTGGIVDFGTLPAGSYTVVASNNSTHCISTMQGTSVISISSLPTPYILSGGGPYCAGGLGVYDTLNGSSLGTNYQLLIGGLPVSGMLPIAGTGSPINFGLLTAGGHYTVSAYNTLTTCSNTMLGFANITVNPAPIADTVDVTGGGTYCTGGTGVDVSLNNSSTNTNYQLYLNGVALTDPQALKSGSGFSLDFGARTATGTYSVGATITSTGCTSTMVDSAVVTTTPVPAAYTVTGGGPYCSGGNGAHVFLSFSDVGVDYQLYHRGFPVGTSLAGSGTTLDFGLDTAQGSYTVVAGNGTTGCSNAMTGSVTISTTPLPYAYAMTGGGKFCADVPGIDVGLAASNTGINYQLFNGTIPMGGTVHGSGLALDFGLQSVTGNYTVVATNGTTGCTQTMATTDSVIVVALPNSYAVTGGGDYCAGGSGKDVGLFSSDAGVSYQLFDGSSKAGRAITGTGSNLDFGIKTTAGNYTVIATDPVAGCTGTMSGSATINIDLLPNVYTITGGGNICAGDTGTHIFLSGSDAGISYQLYDTIVSGAAVLGGGTGLDFGARKANGTYTVLATNTSSGCSSNMASPATITVNSLPAVYTVTGGGAYCAGGIGDTVSLSNSNVGITYQLWLGGIAVGFPIWGTGSKMSLGIHSATGTYTIQAINPATTCTSNMLSSAVVSINPILTTAVSISSDTTFEVCAGTPTVFTATPANGGLAPTYMWTLNGAAAGSTTSTYATDTLKMGDIVGVTITSSAACASGPASATERITVDSVGTPAISMSADPAGTVCPGTSVTFSAVSPVLGGSSPTFTWSTTHGGVVTGTGGFTYTYVPGNGDIVSVVMTSNDKCATTPTATANLTENVTTLVAPVVTIAGTPSGALITGQSDTLKASVTANGGPDPTYQWIVNGSPVAGATSDMYISSNLFNGDSVACQVTGSGPCGGLTTSKHLIMSVHNLGASQLNVAGSDIRVVPNPNKGLFTISGTIGTNDEEVSVEITNMVGQVVYSSGATVHGGRLSENVQMNNTLPNGMYLLNVHTTAGNNVFHFVLEQ